MEWISVNERKPEEKEDVLVYHQTELENLMRVAWYYKARNCWYSSGIVNDNNTHRVAPDFTLNVLYWMPLPKSPEMDN